MYSRKKNKLTFDKFTLSNIMTSLPINKTSINTNTGYKSIEDVWPDDYVLTSKGYRNVLQINKQWINENIYEIYSRLHFESLKLTSEHLILVKKSVGDQRHSRMDMTKLEFIKTEEIQKGYYVASRIDKTVNDDSKISENFARLLGYYIGDGNLNFRYSKNGNVKSARFRLTYHCSDKREIVEDLINIVKEYDPNINHGIYESKKELTNIITFYSTKLAKEIAKYTGTAKNKFVGRELLFMSPKKQLELLKGWHKTDGTGRFLNSRECSIFTAENNLARDLIFILQRCKLIYSFNIVKPGLSNIKGKMYQTKGGYKIIFHNTHENSGIHYYDNLIFARIKKIKIEKYEGYIHSIETDKNGEYQANNYIVKIK